MSDLALPDGDAASLAGRPAAARRLILRASAQLYMLIGGFALLLLVGIATVVLVARDQAYVDWLDETRAQQIRVADLLSYAKDAETGQRGYLLTGDPSYRQPYDEAVRQLPELARKVAQHFGDDQALAERAARAREVMLERLAVLARTIELYQKGRQDEALDVVLSGRGKAMMDELRATVEAIESIMARQIRERGRALDRNGGLLLTLVLLGLAIAVLLAFASLLSFRSELRTVHAARQQLSEFNVALEAAVAERTVDLREANAEIQRFAYIVSHDLRAPLVNIMGFTSEIEVVRESLREQLPADSEPAAAALSDLGEAVTFITTATSKMDRLIAAILALSRAGRRVFTPERLDMTVVVDALAANVRHRLGEAGAELDIQSLPDLTGDRLAVEQIFGNLLDNAVKYLDLGRPGRITVSGQRGRLLNEYRVADNGRGIDPKDHERVFELFRRAGAQDRPGEGIGLAHVRALVRRLGGNITLQSELGQGATFAITLPRDWRPHSGNEVP